MPNPRAVFIVFSSFFLSVAFTPANTMAQDDLEAPFRTKYTEFKPFDTKLLQLQINALTTRDLSGLSHLENPRAAQTMAAFLTQVSVAELPKNVLFDKPGATAFGKVLQVGADEAANHKDLERVTNLTRNIVREMVAETVKGKEKEKEELKINVQTVGTSIETVCPAFPWSTPTPAESPTPLPGD
jgi:hypothetical protein